MYDAPMFAPQGWQCPICKRVYSPTIPMCFTCGNEEIKTVTTGTNTEQKRCDCYHTEYGKPQCWGTKEREECSCGGDMKKCDFYKDEPISFERG